MSEKLENLGSCEILKKLRNLIVKMGSIIRGQ